jgi:polysaccharide pyruvyl transferase WcaK-like protein
MLIHHYFPQKLNIGDTFVRDGIQRLIREQRPGAKFVDFPVNKPAPDRPGETFGLRGDNVDRNNAEADLVVIGGSNLYQCRKSGQWGVVTDADSIDRLNKPVMLIGLGAGSSFADTVRRPSAATTDEIRRLNRKAVGSSIRDLRTGQFLDSLDVTGYRLTGCPATFVFDRPFAFNTHDLAAVSFPPVRFRRKRLAWFWLTRTLRKYLAHVRSLGLRVALTIHNDKDVPVARRFAGDGVELFVSNETKDFYELYSRCRFVVGFRLHATIISLSLGTPFVPVAFDWRGTGFAETYGATHRMIPGGRWGLYKAMIARTAGILAEDRTPFEEFIAGRAKLRAEMTKFIGECLAKTSS